MKKSLTKTGTCKACGINCYAETKNEPSVWPCGIEGCPYTNRGQVLPFPRSETGSSLFLLTN
jgi:hypothetical protein